MNGLTVGLGFLSFWVLFGRGSMRFLELTLKMSNRTFLVNAEHIISIEDCGGLGRAVRTIESAREDEDADWVVSETLDQIKQMLTMARDNSGPTCVITPYQAESHHNRMTLTRLQET